MEYTITLSLYGKDYVGKGATALDALNNLEKPEKLMGKATIKIEQGALSKSQLLMPPRLKMLFYTSKSSREIQAKQLALGMK